MWLLTDYIYRDYIYRDYINRDYINRDYINRNTFKHIFCWKHLLPFFKLKNTCVIYILLLTMHFLSLWRNFWLFNTQCKKSEKRKTYFYVKKEVNSIKIHLERQRRGCKLN